MLALAPICCQGAGVGLRKALEDATLDEEGDNLTKAMFQTGRQSCPRPSSACLSRWASLMVPSFENRQNGSNGSVWTLRSGVFAASGRGR